LIAPLFDLSPRIRLFARRHFAILGGEERISSRVRFSGTRVMRHLVKLHAAYNALNERLIELPSSNYVRRARHTVCHLAGSFLSRGVEVLLWVVAGGGAIALALSTHEASSPLTAVASSQPTKTVRGDRLATSSPNVLESRARAELSSKMRAARFDATSVEWAKWLETTVIAAGIEDRPFSLRVPGKLAGESPTEPTITGSISVKERDSSLIGRIGRSAY
jgi:hypothetical protein